MKRVLLVVGIAVLALLAAFLLQLESGSTSASIAPPIGATQVDAATEPELAPAESAPADARMLATEPATIVPDFAATAPASTTADPAPEPLVLAGTIVVVDEQGVEHRTEDGSFSFVLWTGDSGAWHEVEVHAGRWRTEIPRERAPLNLGLEGVRLGGRAALGGAGFEERFPVPTDGWLALTARWPKASRLHVRDSASGRELAPVLLATVGGWPESSFAHPGSAGASARDLGPSPVELPPSEHDLGGTRTIHVRSPGYAWGRIEVDESRGGERILLLEPAGELEIALSGNVGDPGTKLRVFGKEYSPAFQASVSTAGTIVVDALRAGSYRIRVEIGEYWREPVVLAEGVAEVVAGQRVRVALALEEAAVTTRVPLSGTLVLPAAWELESFALDFELLDTPLGGWDGRFSIASGGMKPEGDPPGVYRWSAPAVQPGRYEVELRKLAFRAVLTVGEVGLNDARIVVQPPCDVRVRCVDEDTDAEVTLDRVTWVCAIPDGIHGWSHESAEWDEALRRWRFRAPQGGITISVNSSAYAHVSEAVDLHAGTNEVVLRLARPIGLRVILRDGTTEIPWGGDAYAELTAAEGQAEYSSWSHGNGRITLHKRQPGRYTLKVPPVSGFEPVPEAEVVLEKSVVKEHVVELVRLP